MARRGLCANVLRGHRQALGGGSPVSAVGPMETFTFRAALDKKFQISFPIQPPTSTHDMRYTLGKFKVTCSVVMNEFKEWHLHFIRQNQMVPT